MRVTDLQDQLAEVLMNMAATQDPPLVMAELPTDLQTEFRRRARVIMEWFEKLLTQQAEGDDETIVVHPISEFGIPMVELTRYNLTTLLEKLDDPLSARTLIDGQNRIAVKAVEDVEHYANRPPGAVHMPSRPGP
jgi:hypothetical protein